MIQDSMLGEANLCMVFSQVNKLADTGWSTRNRR